MTLDDLMDERERLIGQRASVLRAASPAVMASDLDQEAQEDLRVDLEQALDDAFFALLDPLQTEIEDKEAALNWQRQRADIVCLRRRQGAR